MKSLRPMSRLSLLCAAGFHHDGTDRDRAGGDAFGGYSPTCLRCDRPSTTGPTPVFRGSAMSVFGVLLIADSLLFARGSGNEIFGLVCGSVLFVLGLGVIWFQRPG